MQSFRRLTTSRALRSLLARPQTVSSRQFVRRLAQNSGQETAGHMHGKRSSDLPWIIGAIGFTIPATFYLLSSASKPAHHSSAAHGHGHAAESEESGASNATSEDEGSSSDEAEEIKQVDSTDQDTEESAPDAHGQAGDITEEIGGKADEAKNKAESGVVSTTSAVKEKAGEVTSETRKKTDEHSSAKDPREDEAKDDGNKVGGKERGETSDNGGKEPINGKKAVEKSGKETKSQTLECLNKEKPNKKPSDIDPPAAGMKDVTSTNMQSGKQEGISNSDTSHAVLHSERGQSISKKAEGAHETAKLKGTVDPFRPADYDATK